MSALLPRLRSLGRVAWRDPGFAALTCVAWGMLVVGRGVITAVPLRRIATLLGAPLRETAEDDLPEARYWRVRRIRRAIRRAAPHTPTNSNCYPQALTAHLLLRAARLPSTLYYGARFDPAAGGLETHVWVRCGRDFVTGAPEHRSFGALAAYAYVPRRAHVATLPARLPSAAGDAD